MRRLPVLLLALLLASAAHAGNKPCSGKKGGVSHCAGGKHVCNDGSISGSKNFASWIKRPNSVAMCFLKKICACVSVNFSSMACAS